MRKVKKQPAVRAMVRQGDVLLVPVESVPVLVDSATDAQGRNILAYGEVSGHAHEIVCKEPKKVAYRKSAAGERFIIALDKSLEVALKHGNLGADGVDEKTGDHTALFVTGGDYQQGFQVEDFGEYVRPVSD